MWRDKLFADAARRQRAHQRHHYRQVLFTARQALAYQVVWRDRQVALFQRNIGAEAVEEGQLEVGCLTQRAVWAHLDTVAIVQADIEWSGDNRIEAFTEHPIAVRPDHVVTDTHTLRAIDTFVWIAQDEAMRQIYLIVMVVARLTIMEAIIRQAMLDTIFLQVALACSRAGAL